MNSVDEIGENRDINRMIVEKGEKNVLLKLKMMEKLQVNAIPDLEFDTGEETLKFSDMY